MMKKRIFLLYVLMIALTVLFSGCAGLVKNMRVVPSNRAVTAPIQGKSMVIFIRASILGGKVQSSVFEIKGDSPSLVGILAAKKKVSYQLEPGKHIFMVVGENADFMSAEIEENKTYYVLVEPRMGWWKSKFVFKAVHANKLNSPEFHEWLNDSEWVEMTSDSANWANSNMMSIKSKYSKYYGKWMSKAESDRTKLLAQDGKLSKFSGLKQIKSNENGFNNDYSPQDAVDSFDYGNEYYSQDE